MFLPVCFIIFFLRNCTTQFWNHLSEIVIFKINCWKTEFPHDRFIWLHFPRCTRMGAAQVSLSVCETDFMVGFSGVEARRRHPSLHGKKAPPSMEDRQITYKRLKRSTASVKVGLQQWRTCWGHFKYLDEYCTQYSIVQYQRITAKNSQVHISLLKCIK